jgi:hypothetical protein
MEAVIIDRKQTAFRLRKDLLNRLRIAAKKENRSLNNYVESVLMNVAYENEPNEVTLEAIREAKSGKFAGIINTGSIEAFIKSCEE